MYVATELYNKKDYCSDEIKQDWKGLSYENWQIKQFIFVVAHKMNAEQETCICCATHSELYTPVRPSIRTAASTRVRQ